MLKLLRSKKIRSSLVTAALLCAAIALIAAPGEAVTGAKEGLSLCFNVIVPSGSNFGRLCRSLLWREACT